MTKKLTTSEFISKCKEIHSPTTYDYLLVEYTNEDGKVEIICKKHGSFLQRAGNHRRGTGCPACANANRNRNSIKTHEQVLVELAVRNKTNDPVYFYKTEKYINARTPITWTCHNNHQWKARFGDIKRGHGCPKCAVQVREKTMLANYGVKYTTQKHLSPNTLLKLNDPEYLANQHSGGNTLESIASTLGVSPKVMSSKFDKFNITKLKFPNSQPERDIGAFLSSIGVEFESNTTKILKSHELDAFIPSQNVAIEYNGIRWHSELMGRDRTYHISKTLKCLDNNIQLLHISEPEWVLKNDITKSMIANRLGQSSESIYGRKCKIVEVDHATTREFLDNNHIQGYNKSSINIGLLYEDELVSMLTLSKSRFSKKHEYEIYRFCNKLNTTAIGGASKMYKYFVNTYDPTSVITYADRRFGEGKLYGKMGFEFSHNSKPSYSYFKKGQIILHSRMKFQKHKLHKLLETFNPGMTEWQNMVENGYDRIWDCGNAVWVWHK